MTKWLIFVTIWISGGIAWASGSIAAPVAKNSPSGSPSPLRRYEVVLRPAMNDLAVSGRVRIEFDEKAAGWPVRIPRHELSLDCIKLNGRPANVTSDGSYLEIPCCRVMETAYSGRPQRGLMRSGQTLFSVFSTFHWMPCLEEPSVRAPLSLTLILPSGLEAVATGRLVSRREIPASETSPPLTAWRFELDQPYPSYLYGFAAGPFVRVTKRLGPVELVAVSDRASAAKLQRLLDMTGQMMEFFAGRAGLPYPLPSCTLVVVDGGAAQEMAGLSILGMDGMEGLLEGEENHGPAGSAVPGDDWLPAHELSHSWWGNLITCRDWQHFWLNEGFAVFMTAAWKEHGRGPAGYSEEMERARKRWKQAQDAGADHPLAYGGEYPDRRLRNCIVYSKAALFLDELRHTLGDGVFWRGVREYTRACRGCSVESTDFERIMSRTARKDLRKLFQQWVHPAAKP